MINIDFLTLRAFLIENIGFLVNARIQKIQQPTRRDFIFSLRNNGQARKLYININPQIYHIAFMSEATEKRRRLVIPTKPPMFCMLLRKYIEGAKILDSIVLDKERIIEFLLETYNELGDKRTLVLSIELMGKHSNIILYDKISSIIIGCAHNVGAEKSRYRELQGGMRYILPPKSDFRLSHELEIQFKGLSDEKIKEYLTATEFSPASNNDKYTLFQELLQGSKREESINSMIDNYYSKYQEEFNLKSEKTALREVSSTKLRRTNSAIDKINQLLKKRDNTERYKLYGELLTANLYQKADYQDSIEVFDYINNENLQIALDPNLTLNENAQKYYKLYTKSKFTKEKSEKMLEKLNLEKIYLENVLYSIDCASCIDDLSEIKQELGNENTQKKNITQGLNITKINISGFVVYIGKNNKQNDYIISKLAKDEDYWFHIKGCAGSHVLLKTSGKEPNESVLYECLKIARQYSSAKQPSKVGVIYTQAKYLKKPPSSPLGYVTYKNEKEVLI